MEEITPIDVSRCCAQCTPENIEDGCKNLMRSCERIKEPPLVVKSEDNDGQTLLCLLSGTKSDAEVLNILSKVNGPYAFIFYQEASQTLWLGRDFLGRRSLTYCWNEDRSAMVLASVLLEEESQRDHGELRVSQLQDWKELPASGIYKLNLLSSTDNISCHKWKHNSITINKEFCQSVHNELALDDFTDFNKSIPETNELLHDLMDYKSEILECATSLLQSQCRDFLRVLTDSVFRRVGQSTYHCNSCTKDHNCDNCHISIMFSGGIDSMTLAYLVDRCLPEDQPIDLLNVAFETKDGRYDVPDRETGLVALGELNPNRKWNFVEINVTKEELAQVRQERISQLIQPLDSVLDDSIGCAIWFASRGEGVLRHIQGRTIPYKSTARVVLSGLGADEQLGGYSRHRSSYTQRGWAGLVDELDLDIRRISERNLGRDDRVISDHGKEARFPFLDEKLMSYLNSLPVNQKMQLDLPRGVGEKLLLRATAYSCGIRKSSKFAKRAIQFGSKIAKCEQRKEKGHETCERLSLSTKP